MVLIEDFGTLHVRHTFILRNLPQVHQNKNLTRKNLIELFQIKKKSQKKSYKNKGNKLKKGGFFYDFFRILQMNQMPRNYILP